MIAPVPTLHRITATRDAARLTHVARTVAWYAFVCLGSRAFAQTPTAPTTTGPAPRVLPAPLATSPRFAGNAFHLVALPDGSLLINDVRNRRVMRSDSLLRTTQVVIDTTDYGTRGGTLLRYRGDSALFIEAVTPSMTLIDPRGAIVRTMAVPRPRDVGWMMPSPTQPPGIDGEGRLISRGAGPRQEVPRLQPNAMRVRTYPDTSPVVRDNRATRGADTLAWVRTLPISGVEVARADGRSMFYARSVPAYVLDEWTVLSDGTLMVVRGRDYHIDRLDSDGQWRALPRLPFPWRRINDDDKQRLIDSVETARLADLQRPPGALGGASGGSGGSGMSSGGSDRPDFPSPPADAMRIRPDEIPDYHAPFGMGAVFADAEAHVWIRTTIATDDTAGVIYDIVDRDGTLTDRVVLPKQRGIIGFDTRGHVYLLGRADGGVQWIERVRWRR